MSTIHLGNGSWYSLKDVRKFVEMTKDSHEDTWVECSVLTGRTMYPEFVGCFGLKTKEMYIPPITSLPQSSQEWAYDKFILLEEEIGARSPDWFKVECTLCGVYSTGYEPVAEEWGYEHVMRCEDIAKAWNKGGY